MASLIRCVRYTNTAVCDDMIIGDGCRPGAEPDGL